MTKENLTKISEKNECSSCKSWKVDRAHSKSRLLNTSASGGKLGLCVGGGFDGSHTQSDETCSMWKPINDKQNTLPKLHDKGVDEI